MTILNIPTPSYLSDGEFAAFGDSASRFLDTHAGAEQVKLWRQAGLVPRSFWKAAGEAGLLGLSISEKYGGHGGDFRHEVVLMEHIGSRGIEGWDATLHNAIIAPYLETYGSEAQKLEWLPQLASGDVVAAIAMTEPGTGSDLKAVRTTAHRDGDEYVINGSKTFISNGQNADLILVVAKTDSSLGAKGISLLLVIQFKLAELKTEATIAGVFVNHCVSLHLEGRLDTATASMAKYWVTDLHCKLVDECLQLHGGYGYMSEYPIAQAYKDARVNRIYGGTNEIMKLLIARTL